MRTVSTLLLVSALLQFLHASEKPEWSILRQALHSGGGQANGVLGMLGTIDDPTSQELLRSTLKGKTGGAIDPAAAGLSPQQCSAYLPDLARAARDPKVQPKGHVLGAIARAESEQAASILGQIAESASEPTAGLAFGVIETMGSVAEPVLQKIARGPASASARGTAVTILGRISEGTRRIEILRTALHDSDEPVRVIAALRLAQLGYQDGLSQLKIAADDPGDKNNLEAIVGYGSFGDATALKHVEGLLQGPDTGVRVRVVWAIAPSGSISLKQLAYKLRLEQDPNYAGMLADRLYDVSDPRDRSELQILMQQGDEPCSLIAAQRLLSVKNLSSAAEAVIGRGLVSQDHSVRDLALQIMLKQPTLRPRLADHLTSSDLSVQLASLSVIAELRDESRFAGVAHLLKSNVSQVSEAAARTLVRLDTTRARGVMTEALKSGNTCSRIFSAAMLLASESHK